MFRMDTNTSQPQRRDDRVIVHFDYDCFYASVFEAEDPSLKTKPLAVQQKQIIVTCNYVARARGLRKLQLIHEARKMCPDLIIILGEDLTKFRDASKANFSFLQAFSWNQKMDRLGFDEVFMDITDIIEYNEDLLNPHDLENSFFHMSKSDPTHGFAIDASTVSGKTFPALEGPFSSLTASEQRLMTRLRLGSHFADYLRNQLKEVKGFSSTVGISTNKELSKMVGNVHKPDDQTTLIPPYYAFADAENNVLLFLNKHDIRSVPGIGFKMSQLLREFVLSRPANFDDGLIYGETKENVTVADIRCYPGMSPQLLESILGGSGIERDIGKKVWELMHGVDDTEVKTFSRIASQISIEDSYLRLDTLVQVQKELKLLATSLLKRMHADLLESLTDDSGREIQKWIAFPKTLRLSTRPRLPLNADGTRTRTFKRISRSAPLPGFVFSLSKVQDSIVEQLVEEHLMPMFRRLHPEKQGWNLSLINICVTNMVESAGDGASLGNRDIGKMFQQYGVLQPWQVEDKDVAPDSPELQRANEPWQQFPDLSIPGHGEGTASQKAFPNEDLRLFTEDAVSWDEYDDDGTAALALGGVACGTCGAVLPAFAIQAHSRFHELGDT